MPYKDLFNKVENAIAVYTSEIDHSAGGTEPEVLLKDRLELGKERLDKALEALALLCEPVKPPCGELEHIHYFCGNTEVPEELQMREPQRVAFYKAVVALIRAYANIADEMEPAGYSAARTTAIKKKLEDYLSLREIIRKASGETLDLKAYEADMRHLIDTYIQADEPRKISPFDNMPLLELIVKTGIADAIAKQLGGLKGNREAIAETIENNVRSKIIKEHLNDPAFYEKMSSLLDEIIVARKTKALEYEEYLKQIAELAKRVEHRQVENTPEPLKKSAALRALYNNVNQDFADQATDAVKEDLAEDAGTFSAYDDPKLHFVLKLHAAVMANRPDQWRGNQAKENMIMAALHNIIQDENEVKRIFQIIKQQAEY